MIFERLQYQRSTGRFCDVEIIVQAKCFAAHRNILAAHSPYFDAIFKYCKITKEQLTINSKYPQVFELFLNYMYSGSVIIDRSSVSELLRFANNFLIVKLKNYCAEYLDRYMDAANCLSIRSLAQRYNLPGVIKSATDYFDSNLNRCLLESRDIIGYTYTQLTRLIGDPKYQDCITADTYLKLIVRWVGEEMAKREEIFRLLLESCAFNEVTADTLEFLLDYSPLLSKSQKSRFLLLHVMEANNMLMEKYSTQLANLRQKLVNLPTLHEPSEFEDDIYESSDSEEDLEEYIADGHPSSAQVMDYGNDTTNRLKVKSAFQPGSEKKKLKRPKGMKRHQLQPIPQPSATENESIPWIDEDGIDGVYATCSLEGCHTYGPVDHMDPDDCEDEEDQPDENGPVMCHFCGYRTANEELLEKHKARYHNRNTYYMCHLCEFETNWSKQFYLHCAEHWTELPYQCEMCSFNTDIIQEFLTHRLSHTDERFFKCGECAWKGRTRSQLFAHERMHSILDDRPLHCEECGRGFLQHAALDHHIATHNDHSRPTKNNPIKSAGTRALVFHDPETPPALLLDLPQTFHFSAGCDYSSTKKSQLAAHLRTHMAVRAHLCKVCGRGFIEKSHLVRHERIHLEEKPFKCDQCEYASSRRDKLKEHIIKHHNADVVNIQKTQRRKYKRARMLAAANNLVNNPEVMFRPITSDDAVSNWQASNDFSAYSPNPNDYGGPSGYQQSPQRAYSVVHPSQHHQHAQSPGCMSMMNVPLGDHHGMTRDSPIGGGGNSVVDNSHGVLMTPNLVMRSPHNRSAVQPQYSMQSTSDAQQQQQLHSRPFSLPTYDQLNMVQAQAQLQQQQQSGNQDANNSWSQWNGQ
ncbi:CBN-EOR-1 protein [Caenorhabditis brenneri]|uniref:CBN-EOR-1 protein n=1 Tax=Caenorhabditis brenneri TaxID=135651 RepID=G0P2A9_CAEBE|nr:CBN-EOR-1 protein [Caenorhabditis brenneri]